MKGKHMHYDMFLLFRQGQKATLICFLSLCFFCVAASAQSYFYYETNVKKADSTLLAYHIFLTVNENGSGQARILYTDADGINKIVQQNYNDSSSFTSNSLSDSLKILSPIDKAKNADETDDTAFIAPRYLFKKQISGNTFFYIPAGVDYTINGNQWQTATTTVSEQKTFAWLSQQKDFVKLFFNAYDPFYKYLFNIDNRGLNNVEKQTKLFLIVVANTKDSVIGANCRLDMTRIINFFTTLTGKLNITMLTDSIAESALSKTAVDKAIDNWLKPSPNDIVVFYYSGHGFRYSLDISKYARMSFRINGVGDLSKNNLLLEDVYKRILNKGAKVNIVIGDCCNSDIGLPPSIGLLPFKTRDAGITTQNLNIDISRALFFPTHPISAICSAAEKGERSVCNPKIGGFYTNFFLEEMNKTLYGNSGIIYWLRLMLNAQESTRKQALTALCDDISHRCIQKAEIDVEPKF